MSTPRRIVRPGRSEYIHELVEFTAEGLRESGADESALHDLRVAVSEVCANVVDHGYTDEHSGSITIETNATEERFIVRIEDDAPAFDPATLPPADIESGWERRKPGRLGWYLVYSVMDEVRHETRGNRGNIVTLTKRIRPTSASAPEKG